MLALCNVIYHFGGPPLEDPELQSLDHMAERCIEVARKLKAGAEA